MIKNHRDRQSDDVLFDFLQVTVGICQHLNMHFPFGQSGRHGDRSVPVENAAVNVVQPDACRPRMSERVQFISVCAVTDQANGARPLDP